MTEAPKSLLYLPIIYLWSGGVEGYALASLAPPVHLSGEHLGWTLLVCMVGDLRWGHLEVSWRSPSENHVSLAPNSVSAARRFRGQSAVSSITVMTYDWPSYSCSVTHRRRPKATRRHRVTSGDGGKMCYEDDERRGVAVWTETVLLLSMRLLFLKILTFNTLMTSFVVIKW